jgi:hypothetical protein
MAFDASLAARIRGLLAHHKEVEEKKMFGGLAFLIRGNVAVGVWKGSLIARLGPDEGEAALRETHVRPFDITGRAMSGWVMVGPEGVAGDDELSEWVGRCLRFAATLAAK